MHYLYFLAGGVILTLTYILRLSWRAFYGPLARIPGPTISRFVPLRFQIESILGKSHYYIHDLHQKYGPVVRVTPDMVIVADSTYAKQIYKSPTTYLKSDFYDDLTGDITSVFAMRGIQEHSERRRLLAAPMSESQLKLMEPRIQAKVDEAMIRMAEESARDGFVDVWKWNHAVAMDVITDLTMGQPVGVLKDGYHNQFVKDFETSIRSAAPAALIPWLYHIMASIPGVTHGPKRARDRTLAHSKKALDEYYNFVNSDYEKAMESPTVFTRMLKAKEEHTLNEKDMLAEVQAFIVAGGDTTSTTLSCLFWAVAQRPDVQAKLVEEIRNAEDLTNQSLKKCTYMDQVIEETQRLYGPGSAWWPRDTPAGGDHFGDHYIPGGTRVAVHSYTMHRDPNIFPDPLNFNPDRWADPTQSMKDSFLAWGGGARICLGMNLARMEMRLMIANFYLNFPKTSLSERADPKDMEETNLYILIAPKGRKTLLRIDEKAVI